MENVQKTEILEFIQAIEEPITGRTLAQLDTEILLDGQQVAIKLGYFNLDFSQEVKRQVVERFASVRPAIEVSVKSAAPDYLGDSVAPRLKPVNTIIAVASGKGGVGKSATAVNLALALKAEGAKVGIVDADVYGPSVPTMLGVDAEQVGVTMENAMLPVFSQGIVCNSVGFLMQKGDAAIWRGPMAAAAMQQLFNDTEWPELDYLIVDLPPGTGDIQLTLAQKLPVSGAVVVTTPQNLALADARRGVSMFEKVDVAVCGVVENMSYYQCEACGHENFLFGEAGGEALAEESDVPLLGRIPLAKQIRENADCGEPTVASDPDCSIAGLYRDMAKKVGAYIWSRHQLHLSDVQAVEIK